MMKPRLARRTRFAFHRRALLALVLLGLFLPAALAQDTSTSISTDAPASIPAQRQASTVAIITIHGGIDQWTSISVRRRIQEAQDIGADAIVIELDTPGGELWAFLEISGAIKTSPIPNTIAWVNPNAISAGAFIALACQETVVSSNAIYGDAAPILVGLDGLQQLNDTERAKMLSVPLVELIDSARRNGYDEKLVQGFVALGVELWLVEHTTTGKQLFITEDEYRIIFDGEPITTKATSGQIPANTNYSPSLPSSQGSTPNSPTDIRPATEYLAAIASQAPEEGTDSPNELLKDKGIASNRPILSANDKGNYKLVEYVTDGSSLLTLKTSEIIRFNLAVQTVDNDAQLQLFTGATTLIRLNMSWSERLARFFSYLPVKGFLIVVFLLGMFIEMSAPGLGLPGGVAMLALAGLIAPQFIAGAAAWWGIVAMLGGLGLIAVEVFVIPGFGLFGVGGLVALFVGLLGVVLGPTGINPHTDADWAFAVSTVLLALATSGIGMYFVIKNHNSFPGLRNLVLTDRGDADPGAGMLASMGEHDADVRVGDTGIAITPLHPGGTAEFDGELTDVVCDRGYIDQGTRVRVVEAGGMRIAVVPIENDPKGLFEDAPDPSDTADLSAEEINA